MRRVRGDPAPGVADEEAEDDGTGTRGTRAGRRRADTAAQYQSVADDALRHRRHAGCRYLRPDRAGRRGDGVGDLAGLRCWWSPSACVFFFGARRPDGVSGRARDRSGAAAGVPGAGNRAHLLRVHRIRGLPQRRRGVEEPAPQPPARPGDGAGPDRRHLHERGDQRRLGRAWQELAEAKAPLAEVVALRGTVVSGLGVHRHYRVRGRQHRSDQLRHRVARSTASRATGTFRPCFRESIRCGARRMSRSD